MLIATSTKVYALEENAAAPVLVFEEDGIQCLEEGRHIAVVGLGSGEIVLLANGETRRLETGIEEGFECLAVLEEEPLNLLIGTEAPPLPAQRQRRAGPTPAGLP